MVATIPGARRRMVLIFSLVSIALLPVAIVPLAGDAYSTGGRRPQGQDFFSYRVTEDLQNKLA